MDAQAASLKDSSARVLGSRIHAVSLELCVERMIGWARRGESRYVCACNVHSVVTARLDAEFARALENADLCVPDGAPVAWRLRGRGYRGQRRVSGPDVMQRCCERAAEAGLPVFLYGSTPETLDRLAPALRARYPGLRIAGAYAPPFRTLTEAEDAEKTRANAESGARLVFVALGCPKQEAWMRSHRGAFPGVMLGAGAAFDFLAGTQQRAPAWMQRAGLEWLHRLAHEPRRLWRRYLLTNTLFLAWSLGDSPRTRAPRGEQ
jgi:N-acetylglucosaminyldiphosphoundecaprenol N-acetyl-beta-D-mannosaminyltransferase